MGKFVGRVLRHFLPTLILGAGYGAKPLLALYVPQAVGALITPWLTHFYSGDLNVAQLGLLGAAFGVGCLTFLLEEQRQGSSENLFFVPFVTRPAEPEALFIGQEEPQVALKALLQKEAEAAVVGPGGAGKTQLALRVAQDLRASYPNQYFVQLGGDQVAPPATTDLLHLLLNTLKPDLSTKALSKKELTLTYEQLLNEKPLLLILDGVTSEAQIEDLGPPDACKLLAITTRKSMLPSVALKKLLPQDAHEILQAISPHTSPEITETVCKVCDYLPLAVRLAAARLASTRDDHEALEYISELRRSKNRLALAGSNDSPRAIEGALRLSYKRLNPEAQQLLRRLAVLPHSFDEKLSQEVTEVKDVTYLSDLVTQNLLLVDRAQKRYFFHDLVRSFANRQMKGKERVAADKLYAKQTVALAAEANRLYLEGGELALKGLELFDRERANIVTIFTRSLGQIPGYSYDPQIIIALADAAADIIRLRFHPRECIRWQDARLNAARKIADPRHEGWALIGLGYAYDDLGDARRAVECYEQAVQIALKQKNQSIESAALNGLGNAYLHLGEARRAIEYYERALQIDQAMGFRWNESTALYGLGRAYLGLGNATERAIDYLNQALPLAREIGNHKIESSALIGLGQTHLGLAMPQRAIELLELALPLVQEINPQYEHAVLFGLGSAYIDLSQAPKAMEYLVQALKVAREIGDRRAEGMTLSSLGDVYISLGEARQATVCYKEALGMVHEVGDQHSASILAHNLGGAYRTIGDIRRAIEHYEQGLKLAHEIGDRASEAIICYSLSIAQAGRGDLGPALDYARRAIAFGLAVGAEDLSEMQEWLSKLEEKCLLDYLPA